MQTAGRKKALYLSREGGQAQGSFEQAQVYCEEHGYRLWKGEPCQHDDPPLALDWVREVMKGLGIHMLLLPSLEHIHPSHIGSILTFLIAAQEAGIEVICLNPVPTPLNRLTLSIVPLAQEQQEAGVVSLQDIVQCLRSRSPGTGSTPDLPSLR
jgi:hypothetical protein